MRSIRFRLKALRPVIASSALRNDIAPCRFGHSRTIVVHRITGGGVKMACVRTDSDEQSSFDSPRKMAWLVATFFFLTPSLVQAVVQAKEILVFVTNNPPLICMRNGELDCMAGVLMKNAARAGGFTLKVEEIPWARAQLSIEKSPNAIFASSGRNEISESQYGWIFQVYSDDVYIWTLRDKKIGSNADIAKLETISVRRGSPFGAYVTKLGYADKIVEKNEWTQAAAMLDAGRVDAMCLTGLIGRTNIIDLQKVPEEQVNKFKVGEISWWINAQHSGAISADLQEFRMLLEVEKSKPYFRETLRKYGVRD
jgi:hypothetical protein